MLKIYVHPTEKLSNESPFPNNQVNFKVNIYWDSASTVKGMIYEIQNHFKASLSTCSVNIGLYGKKK